MSDPSLRKTGQEPIRVLLTDDSAVVRGLLTRVLEEDADIRVIGGASNGEQAIQLAGKHKPEIIILDIEMPVMDGITALPQIIKASPNSKVIMCSTLSLRNADITLKAMSLGAADAIAKPTAAGNILTGDNDFKNSLINLVKQIAKSAKIVSPTKVGTTNTTTARTSQSSSAEVAAPHKFTLRDPKMAFMGKPALLSIGSSTGGPPALFKMLEHCKGFDIPIILTQHMPATFTAMLATHIQANSGIPAAEGKDGEVIKPGHLYVAPGGKHMLLNKDGDTVKIRLTEDPPESFCRPAVDPMLRSAMDIYGNRILSVILTGMGSDGLLSCRKLVEAGGRLFAQDEASSVVWGMPGAVAMAGLCHAVVPIDELGPLVARTVAGR